MRNNWDHPKTKLHAEVREKVFRELSDQGGRMSKFLGGPNTGGELGAIVDEKYRQQKQANKKAAATPFREG